MIKNTPEYIKNYKDQKNKVMESRAEIIRLKKLLSVAQANWRAEVQKLNEIKAQSL